jgi:hypothetical protein
MGKAGNEADVQNYMSSKTDGQTEVVNRTLS